MQEKTNILKIDPYHPLKVKNDFIKYTHSQKI